MANDITVAAEPRTTRGKNEARRLRAAGSAPAVVYGIGQDTLTVAVNPKEVVRILHSKTGHNTIFTLAVKGGENTPVMIVDWQTDPVKDNLLHVDMKRIDLTQRLVVKVPVHTLGEPEGVKIQGGLHEVITREIEVECLPNEIPEFLSVDVSKLAIGQAVRASDVPLPGSVRLVSQPEAVISHVVTMKAEEVAAPVAGAEAAPAAVAEPEVIKKGKKDEEDEGPADEKKKK
ncbi:MAG: ribosomal protein [Bryobacterales bacterium]|jgi:large subunit ribosomal protein L25|nr:ribosomal protein [Bryobacterales bacterium]